MSGSDSDDVPPREECEARCQEFASVTGTDTALAMFYLQDRDWDVQRALNSYFEEKAAEEPAGASGGRNANVADFRNALNTFFANNNKSGDDQHSKAPSTMSNGPSPTFEDPEPHRIRVLSWNIDGLDDANILTRAHAVCQILVQEKPDVIFLQEVVNRNLDVVKKSLKNYYIVAANREGYFTAIALRKDTCKCRSKEVMPFYGSTMARNLMKVEADVKGTRLLLMNSHLESLATHSQERKNQLKMAFSEFEKASPDDVVIFGGDLNMRDEEVDQIGGMPAKTVDVWEATGERDIARYTWDLKKNDNKQMPGRFQPRKRFDRMYMRSSSTRGLKPVYFELVGIQRIDSCHRFPSDHWGILAHFDKV